MHRSSYSDYFEREENKRKAADVMKEVSQAVSAALGELQLPQGGIVVIQHLHVNIGSINSASGGGATVTVNMVNVPKPESGRSTSLWR
jgi:hypothetical protein